MLLGSILPPPPPRSHTLLKRVAGPELNILYEGQKFVKYLFMRNKENIAKNQLEHNLKNIFSKLLIDSSLKPFIFATFIFAKFCDILRHFCDISATFIKSVIFEYSNISAKLKSQKLKNNFHFWPILTVFQGKKTKTPLFQKKGHNGPKNEKK